MVARVLQKFPPEQRFSVQVQRDSSVAEVLDLRSLHFEHHYMPWPCRILIDSISSLHVIISSAPVQASRLEGPQDGVQNMIQVSNDSSVGESMNLTICPPCGPGSIPSYDRAQHGIFPWLITLCQPTLSQRGRKRANSHQWHHTTCRRREGSTMNRQWLKTKIQNTCNNSFKASFSTQHTCMILLYTQLFCFQDLQADYMKLQSYSDDLRREIKSLQKHIEDMARKHKEELLTQVIV